MDGIGERGIGDNINLENHSFHFDTSCGFSWDLRCVVLPIAIGIIFLFFIQQLCDSFPGIRIKIIQAPMNKSLALFLFVFIEIFFQQEFLPSYKKLHAYSPLYAE
jgi:hypothetical protein